MEKTRKGWVLRWRKQEVYTKFWWRTSCKTGSFKTEQDNGRCTKMDLKNILVGCKDVN